MAVVDFARRINRTFDNVWRFADGIINRVRVNSPNISVLTRRVTRMRTPLKTEKPQCETARRFFFLFLYNRYSVYERKILV